MIFKNCPFFRQISWFLPAWKHQFYLWCKDLGEKENSSNTVPKSDSLKKIMPAKYLKLIKITSSVPLWRGRRENLHVTSDVRALLPTMNNESVRQTTTAQLCGQCTVTCFTHTPYSHLFPLDWAVSSKGTPTFKEMSSWYPNSRGPHRMDQLWNKTSEKSMRMQVIRCAWEMFRWTSDDWKSNVQAGCVSSSTANERQKHLEKVIRHFLSVESAFCIKSYPNCQ